MSRRLVIATLRLGLSLTLSIGLALGLVFGLVSGLGLGGRYAEARKPGLRHRLRAKLLLKFTTKAPSFSSQRYGEVMDRGRLFYLGRGLWYEQGKYYMLRLKDMKRVVVRAPVQRFLLANRRMFPRAGSGGRLPAYSVIRLLYYDTTHQVAGILLGDRQYRLGGRVIYLHWDLKKKRITRAMVLAHRSARLSWISVKPVGYSPKRRVVYLQVLKKIQAKLGGSKPLEASVIAVSRTRIKTLTTFRTRYSLSRGPFHDPARERVLLVEYAERGSRPSGHLVDLVKGRRKRLAIPVVTYGVAFGADGKRIFAYSCQTGYVWAIDAKTGRRLQRKRVGSMGHAAGMIFKGTLLVARNKGMHFLDAKTLNQWKYVPTKTWHSGFMHVQGTLVTPGRVFLRTSDLVRVIDFKKP